MSRGFQFQGLCLQRSATSLEDCTILHISGSMRIGISSTAWRILMLRSASCLKEVAVAEGETKP
ncbi:Hypothetical predicted protein, partial [Olea europaea subsp. europaea]